MELDVYLSESQKKRRKRRKYFYIVLAVALTYFFVVGIAWFFLRAPIFSVDRIVVQGGESVSAGEVVTLLQSAALRDHRSWKALLGLRNMLIWPSALAPADLVFIPRLAAVTLSRDYFSHILVATVTERKPFAIWCVFSDNQVCYWFDDQGTIFEKSYNTEGSALLAIHDYSQTELGLNGKVLPDPFVPNLISIVNAIRESGVNVKEIALKDLALQEMSVATYDGPNLYFSLRFPAGNDLPVLEDLMAKPGFGKLQYIDFRVENRAYYK